MVHKIMIAVVSLSILVIGCGEGALTLAETRQALDEVATSNQALTSASGTVEISTNFTIGQAVGAAAEELRQFIQSQLPCAEITLVGAKLTVEYGANPGNCTYHGQTYSGSHSIEITSAEAGNLVVHHEWDDLRNSRVAVTGDATVTWSSAESSRNVVHELDWTRLADDRNVVGSGNRTQTLLPGGILEGIRIDGDRGWASEVGDWDLIIDGIEMRWVDPVPQAGLWELTTPFEGKTASFGFDRVDEDTIEVTVTSGSQEFSFLVSKAGTVTDQ